MAFVCVLLTADASAASFFGHRQSDGVSLTEQRRALADCIIEQLQRSQGVAAAILVPAPEMINLPCRTQWIDAGLVAKPVLALVRPHLLARPPPLGRYF